MLFLIYSKILATHKEAQTVLNDLWRARLSRSRMIWLLAHPLPPSSISKLNRRHTGRTSQRDNLLTGGGEGVGEEPNHTTWSSINHVISLFENVYACVRVWFKKAGLSPDWNFPINHFLNY